MAHLQTVTQKKSPIQLHHHMAAVQHGLASPHYTGKPYHHESGDIKASADNHVIEAKQEQFVEISQEYLHASFAQASAALRRLMLQRT